MKHDIARLKSEIHTNCPLMTREPSGILRYPYTVPSSPGSLYYAMSLWDWDSWLISIVLGQVEANLQQPGRFWPYELGCILNFLDHTDPNGQMPIQINEKGIMRRRKVQADGLENMHKPVIAQHLAALCKRSGRLGEIAPLLPRLEPFIDRYLTVFRHEETGLAVWQDDFAVGVDNDPSVYYRPARSCGSIYLNSLLYCELLAYSDLLEQAGSPDKAAHYQAQARRLAEAVNRHCWDERDGTYYSVDLALNPIDPSDWLHRGAPRDWSCLLLRIDSWSSFLPLWAGLASDEQAERMVRRYRDASTFNCQYGLRTLSRLEKMYSLKASNNPSNWLGPVWGISNFLVFSGLVRYGYRDDARELAGKTVRLFGQDLAENKTLHEFYHPDTGEPIMTPGFQNWNYLVLNMIAYLEGQPFCDCTWTMRPVIIP
jgi:putative isomerase